MKIYYAFYQVAVLFFMIIFVSCTEDADFPLDNTYVRLVVDGAINTDTTVHMVRLSKSGDALNKHPGDVITNAEVTITDGINNYPLHEGIYGPGIYGTDSTVFGVAGRTYTLRITNGDINEDGIPEEYEASSFLPRINPIDSIQVQYENNYNAWLIDLYAWEIGGGRNFYLLKAYKNGVLLTDSTYEYTNFADNTGFEGMYYNGFSVYYLDGDKADERLADGDVVTLEMDGITQEYKDFLMGFIEEYNPKIPIFSGPSANIITNIEPKDKAVGFFTAYSAHRKSTIYRE
jgi:hypothetical protein